MNHSLPRNPNTSAALGIDDIKEFLPFVVYRDGKYAEAGEFVKGPEYGTDGWFGAIARIDHKDISVDVYDMGIICGSDGKWPHTFTVEDTSVAWE